MEGCKGRVVHSDGGEQDVLQWWPCSSGSWGDHWQHFPFEAAWHFFPCLLAENLRFEVQFGHVEIGSVCNIFPTSWDDILEMEGMPTLLQVLLDNCVSRGAYPILGGDFNACIGLVSRSDDVDLVGCFGIGEGNAQGMLLAQWIMQNGLYIANRQKPTHQIEDSWTCRRSSDGTLTQIDFIVLDRRTLFDNTWNDYVIPIGLDHRCVDCTFPFNTSRVARRAK